MSNIIKFLVFDTETTGLINDWRSINQIDIKNEPFIVQLAYIGYSYNIETAELHEDFVVNQLIDPLYRFDSLTPESEAIHGKSYQMLLEQGIPISNALQQLSQSLQNIDFIIAHNAKFDIRLIALECKRIGMDDFISGQHIICTKLMSKPFAMAKNISATLQNVYTLFNNKSFDGAHDALADVRACANVFINCCSKVGIWPTKNSVLSIQVYSTQYHQQMPKYAEVNAWHKPAQIDCVQSTIDNIDYSVHSKYLSKILSDTKYYVKQLYYDEICCGQHNVIIDKCQNGYDQQIAMSLISHQILCSRFIIMHNAPFHIGMLNAAFIGCGLSNTITENRQFIIDINEIALQIWPNGTNIIKREDIFEKLYNKQPTIDISAAQIIWQNFAGMYDYASRTGKLKAGIVAC